MVWKEKLRMRGRGKKGGGEKGMGKMEFLKSNMVKIKELGKVHTKECD